MSSGWWLMIAAFIVGGAFLGLTWLIKLRIALLVIPFIAFIAIVAILFFAYIITKMVCG